VSSEHRRGSTHDPRKLITIRFDVKFFGPRKRQKRIRQYYKGDKHRYRFARSGYLALHDQAVPFRLCCELITSR
jgi:hypothetical protein